MLLICLLAWQLVLRFYSRTERAHAQFSFPAAPTWEEKMIGDLADRVSEFGLVKPTYPTDSDK